MKTTTCSRCRFGAVYAPSAAGYCLACLLELSVQVEAIRRGLPPYDGLTEDERREQVEALVIRG